MPKYRPVHTKLWRKKWFVSLPLPAKVIFFYLITTEKTVNSGIWEEPIEDIAHKTKVPIPRVTELLGNGSIKNVSYDFENEMVFVHNFRKYNPGGSPVKVQAGIVNEFKLNHKTFLWSEFISLNPYFERIFLTVTEPLSNGSLPIPLPIPLPIDSSFNKKNEQTQNGEKKKTARMGDIEEVVRFLNQEAGTSYKPFTTQTVGLINARMDQGFTVENFKTVISKKVEEWQGTDMEKYIRPQTLFNGEKFEGYLNQKGGKPEDETMKALKKIEAERIAKEQG